MKCLFLLPLLLLVGCSTAQINYPSYYDKQRQRLAEDSINWGPNSNNNLLDSQNGSTYYNRSVEFFGASY